MTIRVFLLDDHELVREGIRSLLESDPDIKVVGEASTAPEALTRVPLAKPDVAILDVRLEEGNGIEVCRDLRSINPKLTCLMLTSFADDRRALRKRDGRCGRLRPQTDQGAGSH